MLVFLVSDATEAAAAPAAPSKPFVMKPPNGVRQDKAVDKGEDEVSTQVLYFAAGVSCWMWNHASMKLMVSHIQGASAPEYGCSADFQIV